MNACFVRCIVGGDGFESGHEGLFFYIPFACFLNGGILLRLVRSGGLHVAP
jgi:hypothetical protein